MNTMLNSAATDIGAGVSEASGMVYYTLEVGYVSGSPSNYTPNTVTTVNGTPKPPSSSAPINPVQTVTPLANGEIIHKVQTGQTLWSIAIAYGVKVADLIRLNGLVATPVIYTGQKLVVKAGATATPTATSTNTPAPPTLTPTATHIPYTATSTRTMTPTLTATPRPFLPDLPSFKSFDRKSIGVILISVFGIALLVILFFSLRPKQK
jgi:LysM repeat protein